MSVFLRLCGGLVSVLALSASSAFTPAGAQSNLGGGFIEFLVTGGGGPAASMRQNAPPAASQRRYPAYAALPDDPAQQPLQSGPRRGPQRDLAPMPQTQSFDSRYERQTVAYSGPHRAGTIIVDTPNRFLFLVQGDGKALRYGIGVGRPGFEWAGTKSVTRKAEWPDWRPPSEMLKRRPDLPTFMAGGPDNPLGARALYLGSSLYRIHGTNEPSTIGQAVSSGCIRMRNEDVVDLYGRVRVGQRVVVI